MSFDYKKYMDALNYTKEEVFDENDTYASFLVNRNFSYFPDTMLFAYEIAAYASYISDSMNYIYWINSIPKRKRYSKFGKTGVDKSVLAVSWMYNISKKKAEEYIQYMDESSINTILQEYSKIS